MSTTINAGSQETVGEIEFASGLKQLAQVEEISEGVFAVTNPAESIVETIPEKTIPGGTADMGDGTTETAEDIVIPASDIPVITRPIPGEASGYPTVEEEAYGGFSNTSIQNLFEDLLTAKAQETMAATLYGTVEDNMEKAGEESAKAFAHYATAAIVGFINNLTIEAQHTFSYSDDIFSATDSTLNTAAVSAATAMGISLAGVKTGKALSQIDTVYTIKVKS